MADIIESPQLCPNAPHNTNSVMFSQHSDFCSNLSFDFRDNTIDFMDLNLFGTFFPFIENSLVTDFDDTLMP
jgi:hypothetical protein